MSVWQSCLDSLQFSAELRQRLRARLSDPQFRPEEFRALVDESPFSTLEILEAWAEIEKFLEESSQDAELQSILGYLRCCCLSLSSLGDPPPLASQVRQMLEEFGIERAFKV